MIFNIIKNDFSRNKTITFVIFLFILLCSFFISSGSSMIINTIHSLDHLFMKADAPHYVQMHSGEINEQQIETWATKEQLVKKQQVVEMVTINGANLFLGDEQDSQTGSVQDISFVKQNESFDFLLDLNNKVIRLDEGEIGVPIYFMERLNLKPGDKVIFDNGKAKITYTITHFVRDALMNPSIVHSKRFLVNESDFNTIKNAVGDLEYLIEFQLNNMENLREFDRLYQSSHLPNQGPTIDYPMFKMLHALTDGVIVAVVIFVSLFLMIISLLCLRLTILSTIEEDYREVGAMKAIGVHQRVIRNIYLLKYAFLSLVAVVIGFLLSLFLNFIFMKNISLYTGLRSKTFSDFIIPVLAISFLLLIIISFCILTFRRFNHISAIDAIRSGLLGEAKSRKKYIPISKYKFFPINISLSIKDIFDRKKMYSLLFVIFVISTFIVIIPINFLNTIQSTNFISYMGIGKSDLRIDMQYSDEMESRLDNIITYLEKDQDVKSFSPMVTYQYEVINDDGLLENITIEVGEMSLFPLKYLEGNAPTYNNEIALSYLQAKDLAKDVGDRIHLVTDDTRSEMIVSGIYQDITNGGKTAKAQSMPLTNAALSYVISLDIKDHVLLTDKINEYTKQFQNVKITHIKGYLAETLGSTIKKVKTLTIISISVGIFISLLITFLFMKLLIAKDASKHAVLGSIGFSLQDIKIQYAFKVLLVLMSAIIVGTLLANVLGEQVISFFWSFLGATKIEFIIYPLQTYVLCPIVLIATVAIAILLSITSVNHTNIRQFSVN